MDATFAVPGSTFVGTISTIGYVARSRTKEWSFSIAKYGAQTSNECVGDGNQPYCAQDAGNGILASNGQLLSNNTAIYTPSTAQDALAWIAHLRARAGAQTFDSNAILQFDNEPDIWSQTHRDCHPNPLSYDELWSYTLNYSVSIKSVYPNIKLAGPIWCCWCAYWWSTLDGCNTESSSHIDKDYDAHNKQYISPWLISQLDTYRVNTGLQLLDYFDIHYYPNVPSDDNSQANQKIFTDQVRTLYDPNYADQGWIGSCGSYCQGPNPNVINLFQNWIATSGTHLDLPLAISEYSFVSGGATADSLFSPSLANAEALAIFAKYNLAYAARWTSPAANTVAEQAFRLYLSYDGQNSKVYGNIISVNSSSAPDVTSYAVYNATQSRLHILLFNKLFTAQNVSLLSIRSIHLTNGNQNTVVAPAYGYNAAQTMLATQTSATFSYTSSSSQLLLNSYALPARSATLLVLDGVSASAVAPPASSSSAHIASTSSSTSSTSGGMSSSSGSNSDSSASCQSSTGSKTNSAPSTSLATLQFLFTVVSSLLVCIIFLF